MLTQIEYYCPVSPDHETDDHLFIVLYLHYGEGGGGWEALRDFGREAAGVLSDDGYCTADGGI